MSATASVPFVQGVPDDTALFLIGFHAFIIQFFHKRGRDGDMDQMKGLQSFFLFALLLICTPATRSLPL